MTWRWRARTAVSDRRAGVSRSRRLPQARARSRRRRTGRNRVPATRACAIISLRGSKNWPKPAPAPQRASPARLCSSAQLSSMEYSEKHHQQQGSMDQRQPAQPSPVCAGLWDASTAPRPCSAFLSIEGSTKPSTAINVIGADEEETPWLIYDTCARHLPITAARRRRRRRFRSRKSRPAREAFRKSGAAPEERRHRRHRLDGAGEFLRLHAAAPCRALCRAYSGSACYMVQRVR